MALVSPEEVMYKLSEIVQEQSADDLATYLAREDVYPIVSDNFLELLNPACLTVCSRATIVDQVQDKNDLVPILSVLRKNGGQLLHQNGVCLRQLLFDFPSDSDAQYDQVCRLVEYIMAIEADAITPVLLDAATIISDVEFPLLRWWTVKDINKAWRSGMDGFLRNQENRERRMMNVLADAIPDVPQPLHAIITSFMLLQADDPRIRDITRPWMKDAVFDVVYKDPLDVKFAHASNLRGLIVSEKKGDIGKFSWGKGVRGGMYLHLLNSVDLADKPSHECANLVALAGPDYLPITLQFRRTTFAHFDTVTSVGADEEGLRSLEDVYTERKKYDEDVKFIQNLHKAGIYKEVKAEAKAFRSIGDNPEILAKAIKSWKAGADETFASMTGSATLSCPQHHPLGMLPVTSGDFNCDVCGTSIPSGSVVHGCTLCQWNMCENCKTAQDVQATVEEG